MDRTLGPGRVQWRVVEGKTKIERGLEREREIRWHDSTVQWGHIEKAAVVEMTIDAGKGSGKIGRKEVLETREENETFRSSAQCH